MNTIKTISMSVMRTVLFLIITSSIVFADSADEAAIRNLVDQFVIAITAGDKVKMAELYEEDGMYFTHTGPESYGRKQVVETLFRLPEGDEPEDMNASFNVVVDNVKAGTQYGYIYGRVCDSLIEKEQTCSTRWFLVTEKGSDGQWRIQADLDIPLQATGN